MDAGKFTFKGDFYQVHLCQLYHPGRPTPMTGTIEILNVPKVSMTIHSTKVGIKLGCSHPEIFQGGNSIDSRKRPPEYDY
jgi:hypothetical protein